jgi:hypothetical protein
MCLYALLFSYLIVSAVVLSFLSLKFCSKETLSIKPLKIGQHQFMVKLGARALWNVYEVKNVFS